MVETRGGCEESVWDAGCACENSESTTRMGGPLNPFRDHQCNCTPTSVEYTLNSSDHKKTSRSR